MIRASTSAPSKLPPESWPNCSARQSRIARTPLCHPAFSLFSTFSSLYSRWYFARHDLHHFGEPSVSKTPVHFEQLSGEAMRVVY